MDRVYWTGWLAPLDVPTDDGRVLRRPTPYDYDVPVFDGDPIPVFDGAGDRPVGAAVLAWLGDGWVRAEGYVRHLDHAARLLGGEALPVAVDLTDLTMGWIGVADGDVWRDLWRIEDWTLLAIRLCDTTDTAWPGCRIELDQGRH